MYGMNCNIYELYNVPWLVNVSATATMSVIYIYYVDQAIQLCLCPNKSSNTIYVNASC